MNESFSQSSTWLNLRNIVVSEKKASCRRLHTIWTYQRAVQEYKYMWQNFKDEWIIIIKNQDFSFIREGDKIREDPQRGLKEMRMFYFLNWVTDNQICLTLFIFIPYLLICDYYSFGSIQTLFNTGKIQYKILKYQKW